MLSILEYRMSHLIAFFVACLIGYIQEIELNAFHSSQLSFD